MRKYIIQISIFFVASVIAVPIFLIAMLQITNYNPPEIEVLENNQISDTIAIGQPLGLVTWNIGYAGLGDDMDFFYDGGTKVRTSLARTRQNMDSIKLWLKEHAPEFVVLQEVDFNSKRTYYMDQFDRIGKELNAFDNFVRAYNYKVRYLPFPPTKPLGRIESGLVSFSRYKPFESSRHSFLARYSWPKQLWMLDRAFLVQKFHTSNGKALYIINTHKTAFDDGTIRHKETGQISEYAFNLYKDGNYVIIAGDWNQIPTQNGSSAKENTKGTFLAKALNTEMFPSDWTIVYDNENPTNRSLETSVRENWETYTLDFAVCSPNVSVSSCMVQPLGFRFSDHNPVKISFILQNQ